MEKAKKVERYLFKNSINSYSRHQLNQKWLLRYQTPVSKIKIAVTYIHVYNEPIIKTIHHTVNIISTEAELFAIRCGINQATQLDSINCIIIIMDSLHAAKWIFNLSVHLYQTQSTVISGEFRKFFERNHSNLIKFFKTSGLAILLLIKRQRILTLSSSYLTNLHRSLTKKRMWWYSQ